ncbi:MAG TPA: S8 family peptidase [Gemmatimonadaceae bacterium]|nr:S8 family peptidase [Gemmatimonadaceae bacterium]
MRPSSSRLLFMAFVVAACGAPATVATTPTPAPTPTTPAPAPSATTPLTAPAVTVAEPPRDWQLLDESTDHIPGIGVERAMRELLAGKTPQRTVLVAIIDNGIDTSQVDLRANLWTNPKERPGNGKDDDGNGYADDIHGWNFIGGKNGDDVHFDTFEVTRQYAACHGKPAAGGQPAITDAARCAQIDAAYEKQRDEINKNLSTYREIDNVLKQIVPLLQMAAKTDSLTPDRVRAIQMTNPQIAQARQIYLELAAEGASPSVIEDGLKSIEGQAKYSLDPSFNPRTVVGDNYADPTERHYGNPDVMGQDPKHGTHVAGIIGAVQHNGIGVDGIAPAVKLMMLRVVPDGDERDKDIGNAIHYAVDNGAQIISMSFGKPYSPYKSTVDDAVKYADAHGVLMVHAAGNDGADLSKGKNFPTPVYLSGGKPATWIEVGASSWKGGDSLAASFSNWGKNEVDVFAPGVDILSTVPGNQYERDSGTSMAAPVVSGLAALIMDFYPNLTATDVKQIITSTVSNYSSQMVARPGDKAMVPFGSLSITGGIVNAYNALKLADQMSKKKTVP